MGKNCDLRCVKFKDRPEKLIGAAQFVFLEPTVCDDFIRKWFVILLPIAYILMGPVVIGSIIFTFCQDILVVSKLKLIHVILCTLGYQLALPVSILIMHPFHCPSLVYSEINGQLESKEHKTTALFSMAMGYIGTGTILVPLFRSSNFEKLHSIHCISGILAFVFAFICIVFTPYYSTYRCTYTYFGRSTHIVSGVFTFVASSICLGSGIDTPPFNIFLKQSAVYVITAWSFITLYTAIIIARPLMQVLSIRKLRADEKIYIQ